MSPDDSISQWLQGVKAGDPAAAQQLWERYFNRMVLLAGQKLPRHARRSFDEEDVALSAFRSFFVAAEQGRFPQLQDREDLWRLLVVLTARKAQARVRHQTRQKRGGGRVQGESVFLQGDEAAPEAGIDQVIGPEPTPAFASEVAEEFRQLLDCLDDEPLRTIALMKMEGFTVDEIAAKLGCAKRAVERKLQLIRKTWSARGPAEEPSA
jgi:DNA-directed RNA polymerase specialized sigma24 family protein